jgi:hypothetical protein
VQVYSQNHPSEPYEKGAKPMLRRSLQFAVVFLLGAACGGIGVEMFNHSHNAQILFERKLRCQTLARTFVRKRSSNLSSASLQRVDYSPARTSCIAEETDSTPGPDFTLWSFNVVDVVTGEVIFATPCKEMAGDCSRTADESQDKAFQKALRSATTD